MALTSSLPNTVADYVRMVVEPYAPAALISPEAVNAICQTADLLPASLTEFFGFECPLGTAEGNADFLISSGASTGGREVLAGQRPGRELPAAFRGNTVWERVFDFATKWNDPASPLFDRVQNVWLEFDIQRRPGGIPLPSVFIGSNSLCHESPDRHWLCDVAIATLKGRRQEKTERCQIGRCLDALAAGSRIFQVGLMLARQSNATRLCVRGIPLDGIADYVRTSGWDGPIEQLCAVIELFASVVERIDLDIDAEDRILPKLGLECYPARGRAALLLLLGRLADQKLCTAPKAEATAAWGGIATERANRAGWPNDLLEVSALLSGRYRSCFFRWLHHVKIVFEPGKPLHAKAYLAVRHLWLDPAVVYDLINARQRAVGDSTRGAEPGGRM